MCLQQSWLNIFDQKWVSEINQLKTDMTLTKLRAPINFCYEGHLNVSIRIGSANHKKKQIYSTTE